MVLRPLRRFLRRRPSPALVVSLIALLVALGGTSYAAFRLPPNSVGTAQLQNVAVTGRKIRNGAVSAIKINPAGLTVPNASQAANSSLFATHGPSYFQPATGTAADSALLGGFPADHFLPASGTAADSALLGGFFSSHFLPSSGTAADSSLLGGFPANYFLPANGTAANADELGGYQAASFYRLRAGPQANTSTKLEKGSGDLTIGADGLPIISYSDLYDPGENLKVLHCGDLACSSGNTISTVDITNNTGQYSSIAVGADGLPLISYVNANRTLSVAHCGDLTCSADNTLTTLGSDLAQASSILIGIDGMPLISYVKRPDGDLKLVHCGSLDCSTGNTMTTVDASGKDGMQSLAVGVDGLPLIGYSVSDASAYTDSLNVVHCGNGDCSSGNQTTTVDSSSYGSGLGQGVSLTIGVDGLPLISYRRDAGTLRIAHCGEVDCSSGNVITQLPSDASGQPSATIGADGLPIISYTNQTGGSARFVHCGTVDCSSGNAVTTLETAPFPGIYAGPVTVGVDGLPLILDYDDQIGVLRAVHCGDAFCVPYFRRR